MGTSDKVWRGRPPPSVTHSPETPMGEGGSGGGGGRTQSGSPSRASGVKGTATLWLEGAGVHGGEGLRIVEAKGG